MTLEDKEDILIAVKLYCTLRETLYKGYFDLYKFRPGSFVQTSTAFREALEQCADESALLLKEPLENLIESYSRNLDEYYLNVFDDCQQLYMKLYHADKLFDIGAQDEDKTKLFDMIVDIVKKEKQKLLSNYHPTK